MREDEQSEGNDWVMIWDIGAKKGNSAVDGRRRPRSPKK